MNRIGTRSDFDYFHKFTTSEDRDTIDSKIHIKEVGNCLGQTKNSLNLNL